VEDFDTVEDNQYNDEVIFLDMLANHRRHERRRLNGTAFCAGIGHIQTLMETLNFDEGTPFSSAVYIYSRSILSIFPGFSSNGVMGSVSSILSRQTSIIVGENGTTYEYQGDPLANVVSHYEYGTSNDLFTRWLSESAQGGVNARTFSNGQNFQQTESKTSLAWKTYYIKDTFLEALLVVSSYFQTLQSSQNDTRTDILPTDLILSRVRPSLTENHVSSIISSSQLSHSRGRSSRAFSIDNILRTDFLNAFRETA
jgi:hypothetical protein